MTNLQIAHYKTAAAAVDGLDLSTQTILITGCNSGLGLETMRVLASKGACIIALARTRASAVEAMAKVSARGLAVECDLSDFHSVARAAKKVSLNERKIDAIVASAGIVGEKKLVKKTRCRGSVSRELSCTFRSHQLPEQDDKRSHGTSCYSFQRCKHKTGTKGRYSVRRSGWRSNIQRVYLLWAVQACVFALRERIGAQARTSRHCCQLGSSGRSQRDCTQ